MLVGEVELPTSTSQSHQNISKQLVVGLIGMCRTGGVILYLSDG